MTVLVTTAALVPFVVFGFVAWDTVGTATREAAVATHRALAERGAEALRLYLDGSYRFLSAAAAELQGTGLQTWQQTQILGNYMMELPEFRELALFEANGAVVATSRLSQTSLRPLMHTPPGAHAMQPIELDEALLPRTQVTLRLRDESAGYLVAELGLEELWRIVNGIQVGDTGYAALVDASGRLVAGGGPTGQRRVAQGDRLTDHPLVAAAAGAGTADHAIYVNPEGVQLLAVSASVPHVGWLLLLEQPVDEAFAPSRRLERTLLVFVVLALLGNIVIGVAAGRSLLRPISDLLRGIDAIGRGRLDERVRVERDDEFRLLGDAFNAMADRLGALQQATIRQERQAMFGRIAAGLVHDLSHPIQNINNNCKLILQMHADPEYRESFARLVKREFGTIQRTFEDLRNLARPIPLERFPVDARKLVHDVVERMATQAAVAGVTLEAVAPGDADLHLDGDLFALLRVLRNLVLNALQATPPGGRVTLEVTGTARRVSIHVHDTGCGIPADRLRAIFDDFVTTKRRGLGLGLAISKKTVEEMGGELSVSSIVGEGSHFVCEFPRSTPTNQA